MCCWSVLGRVGEKGTQQHASQSRRSLFHLYASQDEKTCLAHVVSLDLAEQLSSCWDVCPAGIDV